MFNGNVFRVARAKLAPVTLTAALLSFSVVAAQETQPKQRSDGASELPIILDGSLQNGAWSPTGEQIVFTRFRGRGGYNKAPADILIFDLQKSTIRNLIFDGNGNVSQPGSTWNAKTGRIVFSSTRVEHDEIFTLGSEGGMATLRQLTSSDEYMSYEPSMSPDGQSVVFESHLVDDGSNGVIRQVSVGSSNAEDITDPDEDCRQPNWSPAGNTIVYQKKKEDGAWDLWIYDIRKKEHRQLTSGEGDKTDATFSPDGRWVVYSADNAELRHASLFVINLQGGNPIQITHADNYDGAPSWSPDGRSIVFESAAEVSTQPGWHGWWARLSARFHKVTRTQSPTRLWTIKVPDDLRQRLCLPGGACRE